MPAVFLADRAFLRLSGPDSRSFLNNIITADVESVPQGCAGVAALLTPQGKILFEFLLYPQGDDVLLEVSSAESNALLRRLTMYKLRAAVTITVEDIQGVTVSWNDATPDGSAEDLRFKAAGQTLWRKPGHHGSDALAAYTDLRILNGIAEAGQDYALQDAFPHDVLLDLNGGVSFKKGCYVGQEVVSRMQHRKTARRRVVIVTATAALSGASAELRADDRPLGTLGTVNGTHGLAIARIDRIGEALAKGSSITIGDEAVSVRMPDWTGIEFPTTAEES
ncbi:folate-binding protein YgfZ [Rhizobium sp.]|uniref:CAF17-like 4Fe-4S cluster assembly/insertion protein YgfZ n=1 Tax=Rhizobium sp. TaxID=391 RepID=UPI000E9CB33E|nr:folate-binding protein YgfZ [Rhizobium sp.]